MRDVGAKVVWGDRCGKTERERDKKEACIMASIIWSLLFSDRAEINVGK